MKISEIGGHADPQTERTPEYLSIQTRSIAGVVHLVSFISQRQWFRAVGNEMCFSTRSLSYIAEIEACNHVSEPKGEFCLVPNVFRIVMVEG